MLVYLHSHQQSMLWVLPSPLLPLDVNLFFPLLHLSLDCQQIAFMILCSTSGICCKFTRNQISLMKVIKTKSTWELRRAQWSWFFYSLWSSPLHLTLPPHSGQVIEFHAILSYWLSHTSLILQSQGPVSTSVEPQGLFLSGHLWLCHWYYLLQLISFFFF